MMRVLQHWLVLWLVVTVGLALMATPFIYAMAINFAEPYFGEVTRSSSRHILTGQGTNFFAWMTSLSFLAVSIVGTWEVASWVDKKADER